MLLTVMMALFGATLLVALVAVSGWTVALLVFGGFALGAAWAFGIVSGWRR